MSFKTPVVVACVIAFAAASASVAQAAEHPACAAIDCVATADVPAGTPVPSPLPSPDPSPAPSPVPSPAPSPSPDPSPTPTPTPVPAVVDDPSPVIPADPRQVFISDSIDGVPSPTPSAPPAATPGPVLVPTPAGAADPAGAAAAAAALLTARHQDQCVDRGVLSVQLVASAHRRVVSVTFSLDGARTRTVTGHRLYRTGRGRSRALRLQTFRDLPAGPFALVVSARTSTGARVHLRKVYYHCTPPNEGVKILAIA